ncbi:MAG TPA: tRNA pseudouridine(38-40) synthase TruA [Acidimicrobiales bacterium]|nr:tRNA pseudouridine(38-40) synthase TruA [Acidimicrobiales bacterium]
MVTTPLWPASSSSDELPSSAPDEASSGSPEEPGERARARLLVAYLGSPFHGFAIQPGLRTVAGELSSALERVVRHPVELTCAGRTDAGVHAWGQVVSFDLVVSADLGQVQRSVNKMLGPAVIVREAAWAPPGFDARRWAASRVYRYRIEAARWPNPLDAHLRWHVGTALDVRAMQAASDAFLGEHDFTSFCRHPEGPSRVRRVLRAEWSGRGESRLCFEIEAWAFCHQMVRSLVGTLVEVGQGRRRAGEMLSVLAARDRRAAGPVAPPQGLCLWEVKYPGP